MSAGIGIGAYALIGDCRSAALVSTAGALEWLCWPRFDSPPLFAGLLDADRGGRWRVGPAAACRTSRRYLGSTAVLETRFATDEGVLVLQDFMPVAAEERKSAELWPEHQVLRRIACVEGSVSVKEHLSPRPDFGRRTAGVRDEGARGVVFDLGAEVLVYRSELPARADANGVAAGARLRAGDVRWSSLTFASRSPAYIPPLGDVAERRLADTLAWWREWCAGLRYEGPYREAIVRSAITLKLLTYAPTGAVVAAPTTSLPEEPGGERNWDYRYCWLRDAGMTVRALYGLGCIEEGEAFASWILHATRLTRPEVRVLYDVYGNRPPREREVTGLGGWGGSRPVRVGNGARDQLQMDVYGEVAGAVAEYARRGGSPSRSAGRVLRGVVRTVSRRWAEPDHGIWEVRSGPRRHTYSMVRCWSALDDILSLPEVWRRGVPRGRTMAERDRIRAAVEREGWSDAVGSYVAVPGTERLDASLLLLAEHGFIHDGNRPRFAGTVAAIESELCDGPLVFRYRGGDGMTGAEAAFGICCFWRILALIATGDGERAREDFERLLGLSNDVGLYGEEIAPSSGEILGNFPQAFTHVGLIHAALALDPPLPEAA